MYASHTAPHCPSLNLYPAQHNLMRSATCVCGVQQPTLSLVSRPATDCPNRDC